MSLFQQWFFLFCLSVLMTGLYDVHDRKGNMVFWGLMMVFTGIFAVVTS